MTEPCGSIRRLGERVDLRILAIGAALCSALIGSQPAGADDAYPSHPIRVMVGFAAGGNADITIRVVGQRLSERLGQPVVIDNRPSAGGIIATETAASAPPDGY